MRMWMVDTSLMCNKHLLGEHVELHMTVGAIKKKKQLDGYIRNNCLEINSITQRHLDIVEEMNKRGMNHKSPLPSFETHYLPDYIQEFRVNQKESLNNLLFRCERCRDIFKQYHNYKAFLQSFC